MTEKENLEEERNFLAEPELPNCYFWDCIRWKKSMVFSEMVGNSIRECEIHHGFCEQVL